MDKNVVTLEDALNIATAHMQKKNYRMAETVLLDILGAQPDHEESHYMLGIARYFMGNVKEALQHIERALQIEDAPAEWRCNYGIMLTEQGRYDEAVTAYEAALCVDAEYADIYWNKSHCHWLAGQYEAAEVAARKGTEIAPGTIEAWLNLGTALVKLGREEEAVECWERALEIDPNFVPAWNNIGNALRDMGRLDSAEEKCRKALALNSEYPQAMNNLANVLMDLGRLQESEELYRKTVAAQPDYVEAHNNLAVNLTKQHRFDEAIAEARIALSYRPDYLESLITLSAANRALGNIEEAEKAIHKATLADPESAEVRIDLADLLFMQDRYGDAEIELERAKALAPDTPRVYLKLADVLERGNKIEEALDSIDQAVALNPEMPEAWLRKGAICHVANRAEEAEQHLKKALEMSPEAVNAHLALAELCLSRGDKDAAHEHARTAQKCAPDLPSIFLTLSKTKSFTEDDPDFQKMVALADNAEVFGLEQAGVLNFALFSAYEQIGDSDKAFEHLLKGNGYKRRVVPYDAQRQQQNFKDVRALYSKNYVKSLAGRGHSSDLPVFILGMPRSGTTLTEQILSAHGDVFGAGELMEISMLDSEFGLPTPDNVSAQGQWYVRQIRKRGGAAARITDKMPGNFAQLGKIISILPRAKIIHTRRNPLDTCLSCFKQNFARGQYWSYDLQELGAYYNQYLDLMAHWRDVLPPESFIDIDYEDTVSDLDAQARALVGYAGLPWDEACLQPHKQKRTVLTASKMQVVQPVYKSSVQSWKRYEKHLEPLIETLSAGPAAKLLS